MSQINPPPISAAARELAEKIRLIYAEGRKGTQWPGNGLVEVECQYILDAAKAEAVAEQAAQIEKLATALGDIECITSDDFKTGGFLTGEIPANWLELALLKAKEIARNATDGGAK